MTEELIAPCGMNCSLCSAYQFRKLDLNTLGFRRTYCPGCIPRGKNCLHMKVSCSLLAEGKVRFCYACPDFPCKRLKSLDRRYRTKYHMSMIENLRHIQEQGIEQFIVEQRDEWACPACGEIRCCHNGLCLHCDTKTLLARKKKPPSQS